MSDPLPNPHESTQHKNEAVSRRPGRPSNTLLRFGIPAAGSLIPALVIAWFSLYASNDYGRAISAGFFGCLLGAGYALLLVK